MFVEIEYNKNKIILATAYFPPRCSFEKHVELGENLEKLMERRSEHRLFVLGDFNLPNSLWTKETLASVATPLIASTQNEAESVRVLSHICSYHNLYKVNTISNVNNSFLDLVFSQNKEVLIVHAESALLPMDAYHPPLSFSIQCESLHLNDSD